MPRDDEWEPNWERLVTTARYISIAKFSGVTVPSTFMFKDLGDDEDWLVIVKAVIAEYRHQAAAAGHHAT